ncbi:MAG: serine hydrolase, partial [Desulfobacterales bacterium]
MNFDAQDYYPQPESKGGWRWLGEPDEVRSLARMDSEKLELAFQEQQCFYSDSSSIVIIRNGYLVREFYSFNVLVPTRFDIWSGTKSFTGTAWGLLLEDSARERLSTEQCIDLDSPAYQFIPEGFPLTDPRKELITIRHLLTMTSGIPGSSMHVVGIPTSADCGPFEHALVQKYNSNCATKQYDFVSLGVHTPKLERSSAFIPPMCVNGGKPMSEMAK